MSFQPLPGECYRNAFLWAQENSGWDIVHGIVWNPVIKAEMGHAWNERDGVVYDPSADMSMPSALYYALGKISYFKHYTMIQAAILAGKERTYGAWDPKIVASRHRQRSKKNPSVLSNILKKTVFKELYDLGWDFYYSQYQLSPTKDTKKSIAIDISAPHKVTILFVYETPPGGHGEVILHPKTDKRNAFISVFIGPPPSTGIDGFHTLHALYDHEFIHVAQRLVDYGTGRKRKDAAYPNTRDEHKPHLQQLLYYLRSLVMQIDETPSKDVDKKIFSTFLSRLDPIFIEWKIDKTMSKMLRKDIYSIARSIKPKTKSLANKLRKAGFPLPKRPPTSPGIP